MSNQQKFTPKTVYDHQVLVDVMEGRKKQDNVKTSGSKCNRCAYDIDWNMDKALELWGNRSPFERGFANVRHVCDTDNEDHYIVRSGYVIKEGKAVFVLEGQTASTPSSSASGKNTRLPSPPLQGVSQGPDIYSIEAMVKEQISQLSSHYMAFMDEYKKIVQAQSQEIQTLKGIVTEYIQHNPTEGALKMIISEFLKYMPEPALKPRTADELRDALTSVRKPETSSGYTRGENQNQFPNGNNNNNEREVGFEST